MNARKCAVHSKSVEITSKYLRGECLEHSDNWCTTFSGTDRETGKSVYIAEYRIKCDNLKSKCSLICFEKNACVCHNPDNIIAGLNKQMKHLKQIKHTNLTSYESFLFELDENFLSVYLIQDFTFGCNLKTIAKSSGWTYSGVKLIITSILEALIHLQSNNVQHGNISNTTVFIDNMGQCKVTNFAIVPYLDYLIRDSNCAYSPKDDCIALGELIESFVLPSTEIANFVKRCKSKSMNFHDLLSDPVLLKPSTTFHATDLVFEDFLGSGGFGDVIRVRDVNDNQKYAVKRIPIAEHGDESTYEDAVREVEIFSRLDHENILRYSTCWIDNANTSKLPSCDTLMGSTFGKRLKLSSGEAAMSVSTESDAVQAKFVMCIKMELCERNLRAVINTGELREESREHFGKLRTYVSEICGGLKYLHGQNIIHKDLTPENIFLTKSHQIKIGDFGLSTTHELALKRSRTSCGIISGTQLYLAPEMLNGGIISFKSDMYAFGIILFEMCHRPFTTSMEKCKILEKLKEKNVIIPEYLNDDSKFKEYLQMVKDLLDHDATKRPTAEQLLEQLYLDFKRKRAFNSDPTH